MLDRFAAPPEPRVAHFVVRIGLLGPQPPEELARLNSLADRTVSLAGRAPTAIVLLADGMAAYRTGRYEAAPQRLSVVSNSGLGPAVTTTARLYWAMAEQRAGHPLEARTLFDLAAEAYSTVERIDDWGPQWRAWVIADLTLREAELLIEGAQP
jgi:hypothetical protein